MRKAPLLPAVLLLIAAACSDDGSTEPEVLVPVLTSVSPAVVPVGSAAVELTLVGSGFSPEARVRISMPEFPTQVPKGLVSTWVSETEMRAVVPANQMETGTVAQIAVFSLEAGVASTDHTFTITYPAPTLTSLSYTTATVGQANPPGVTVTGSGFSFGTRVIWNGQPITTLYQTPTTVIFFPPVNAAGTFDVFVRNPVPGGGSSVTRTFTVQPAS
jgi:hypothetical protein